MWLETIPTVRNWLMLRCTLEVCPFRIDALGAYCTLRKCTRRLTIQTEQADQWKGMTKRYEDMPEKDVYDLIYELDPVKEEPRGPEPPDIPGHETR